MEASHSPTVASAVSSTGAAGLSFSLTLPSTPGPGGIDYEDFTPSRASPRRAGSRSIQKKNKAYVRKTGQAAHEAAPLKEVFDLPKASFRLRAVPEFGVGAFGRKSVEPVGSEGGDLEN